MQQFLKILEGINVALTFLFLAAYIYRLWHLRHFAITEQYQSKYPCTRIALCLPYVFLSIPFLVISILYSESGPSSSQFWVIEFGVGECIDGLILMLQLLVLRQELNKQRPYTPIHLLFCCYLTVVGIVRLICVLTFIGDEKTTTFVFMSFYLAFLINAVLLLGYWIAKRQELPEFQKYNFFNFEEFQNTRNITNRNIQFSYMKKSSQNFNYIRPTVSVEKGIFRIILQVFQSKTRSEYSDADSEQTAKQTTKPMSENRPTIKIGQNHNNSNLRTLKIISNNTYNMNQILQLYKLCGRFSISQKLNFESHNMADVYKSLQAYLDSLFGNKKNYLKFMLKFFDVPDDYLQSCQRALRQTFKDSQLDIYANMDKNASIISIRIFKQLWIDDYYLFYMDVLAIDGRFQSRPMRRYNDFQMFHDQLTNIIRKRYGGKYQLPPLPKKYLFNWDESKVSQRRSQLQSYLRSLTNDYKFMLELHDVREATLQFLGFYEVINLEPVNQAFKAFYKNIQIFKGSISKQLTNSQYVTFYEFRVLYNGIPIRSVKKRFNDFSVLHQTVQRWMNNTQISYKFLTLPERHLQKPGPARQQKLRAYLQALIKIPDIWKIYEVNVFLQVGDNSMKDISVSGIHSPEEQMFSKKNTNINEEEDLQTQRFIDEDSFESKGRMSALIDELGN